MKFATIFSISAAAAPRSGSSLPPLSRTPGASIRASRLSPQRASVPSPLNPAGYASWLHPLRVANPRFKTGQPAQLATAHRLAACPTRPANVTTFRERQ